MLWQNPRSSRWRVELERTLLSRAPASADLGFRCTDLRAARGDASSTVPTPRALGWRSLSRTRPTSDVPCRRRGHRIVGSDRLPAAAERHLAMHPRVDPRRPGSLSHDRFRTVRAPPGRLSSCRAVATFTWRVGLDVRLRPRKRALAPVRFDPTAAARSTPWPRVPSKLGHAALAALQRTRHATTEMRTTENCQSHA